MPVEQVRLRPIGHVQTPYTSLAETPIQTSRNPDEPGRLVVLEEYAAGLEGLEGFDYAHLVWFLDRAWQADGRGARPFIGDRLRPVPFLVQHIGQRVGVFATRVPVRPHYLALSLVRVLAIHGNTVDFTGVDLLDGTPVLDQVSQAGRQSAGTCGSHTIPSRYRGTGYVPTSRSAPGWSIMSRVTTQTNATVGTSG